MLFSGRASSTCFVRSSYWTNMRVRSSPGIRFLEDEHARRRAKSSGKNCSLDKVNDNFQLLAKVLTSVLDLVISSERVGGDDVELLRLGMAFGDLGE